MGCQVVTPNGRESLSHELKSLRDGLGRRFSLREIVVMSNALLEQEHRAEQARIAARRKERGPREEKPFAPPIGPKALSGWLNDYNLPPWPHLWAVVRVMHQNLVPPRIPTEGNWKALHDAAAASPPIRGASKSTSQVELVDPVPELPGRQAKWTRLIVIGVVAILALGVGVGVAARLVVGSGDRVEAKTTDDSVDSLAGLEISVLGVGSSSGWRAQSFVFDRGRDVTDLVPALKAALSENRDVDRSNTGEVFDAGAFFIAGIDVFVRIRNSGTKTVDIDNVGIESRSVPIPTGHALIGNAPRQGSDNTVQKLSLNTDVPNPVPTDPLIVNPVRNPPYFDSHAPFLEPGQSATFQITLEARTSAAEARIFVSVSNSDGSARLPVRLSDGRALFRVAGFACVDEFAWPEWQKYYTEQQIAELQAMRYERVDERQPDRGNKFKFAAIAPDSFAAYCGHLSHAFAVSSK